MPCPQSAIAPGNLDGAHLGHRALLAQVKRLAAGVTPVLRTTAMVFDPHPLSVLAPERAPELLTTVGRRRELLEQMGFDHVAVLPFDRSLAAMPADLFAKDVLVGRYGARAVIVGADFRFGQGRSGDVDLLRELGAGLGFEVSVVGTVSGLGDRVSSTRVREQLRAGNVYAACTLLGRVHDVEGVVVMGDQRGRTIGFPTANLDLDPVMLPADGVYAVVVRRLSSVGGKLHHGVLNLGSRPTFSAGRSLEVHIFDFDQEIYGERLRVGFVSRIRAEKKFDGLQELKDQIGNDVQQAKSELSAMGSEELGWM